MPDAHKTPSPLLFPTFTFAVFFAIVLTIGWLLHRHDDAWKLFMLGASYVFYGWITWWWVLLLFGSTIANWLLAMANKSAPDERTRKMTVRLAVAVNLAVLGLFKYFDFFINSVVDSLDSVGLSTGRPLLEVALPVGISFFTFQATSYVIDVHRNVISPASPIDFAVYLAFFPQLVAGPIVRASEFLPQLNKRLDPHSIDLTRALFLIGAGLFKKIVISTYMATEIVDQVFAAPNRYSAFEIIVAVYAYAVQIYADFSGYTDIAIGIALLMGFKFPDNFDRPYISVSIQDFWRRWHMTLSRWLRDYLYISLGGNRGGRNRRDRNLFLTMLLGGLWHGAAWTFVVWGVFHGAGLGLERRYHEAKKARAEAAAGSGPGGIPPDPAAADPWQGVQPPASGGPPESVPDMISWAMAPASDGSSPYPDGSGAVTAPPRHERAAPAPKPARVAQEPTEMQELVSRWLGRLFTFHFVCVGWVFFRAQSVDQALDILWRSITAWGGGTDAVSGLLLLTIAGALAAQFVPRVATANIQSDASRFPVWAQAAVFGVWLVIVDLLGPEGLAPFIYFQF